MRNPWKLTTFVLIVMLTAAVGRGALGTASAEPQPKMHEALEDLRAAARALEGADRDKGGHRTKALEHTRAAIEQVETGIRFDNRR